MENLYSAVRVVWAGWLYVLGRGAQHKPAMDAAVGEHQSTVPTRVAGLNNTAIDAMPLATRSEYFQLASTGHLGTMKRTIRGIVKRDGDRRISLVAWRLG